ncbi:MAG: protein translocase subunit SecD [Polyangiaceae bacterium]|nr:protein translocase subunit SecD [Polyangiaceae bacterium]
MPKKHVLALVSGAIAAALIAVAALLQGNPWAILGASLAAIGAVTWGVKAPARRNPLLVVAIAVGSGALFFHFDNFWGVFVSLLVTVWAGFGLLPVMDAQWRLKVGFVAAVFVGAVLALWPTLDAVLPAPGSVAPAGEPSWVRPLRGIAEHLHAPAYIKNNETFAIAPGLDLSGGLRLVYTVEVDEAIRDKRDHFADEMRQELATAFELHSGDARVTRDELAKLDEKVHVSQPETALIRLKLKNRADKSKIDDRFTKKFVGELGQTAGPADDEITFKIRPEIESQIRDRAVAQAKETVSRRVDELGLREASVTTRDEDIIVEVPGSNEESFRDIKDTIRRTARLEFKMVDDSGSDKVFGRQALKADELPEGEGIAQYEEQAPDGLDASGHHKSTRAAYVRMSCQPPKYEHESLTDCLARLRTWTKTISVPDDHIIGFEGVTEPVEGTDPQQFKQVGWRTLYLFGRAELTGDYITDASTGQDQQDFGRYYVELSFSPAGADRFEEVTGANVNRRFAIILDDVVDSAPVIKQKIGGGRATITMGSGDPDKQLHDAKQLELVLRSGALPAPITPSSEQTIGPSLGRDAIKEALKGGAIGSMAVLLFMWLYYRKSGVVADIAVLFNMLLQLAVLASFGATMTLPGLAGLTLTLGMSVDANVLINERIREELRAGKSVRSAVEAGYSRAWPSIIDGHMTVFISGLILAQYGSGPVKGFAVTLIVGILCSLFTGVFCTRLVFDWWVRGAKVKRLSVGAEFN